MSEVVTSSYNPVTGERREYRQQVAPKPPDYGMASMDRNALAELYRTQKIEDANKAVAAAIQFQGLRGYQEALKRGESAEKAMTTYGPMMYYQEQRAFAPSLKALTPPQVNPDYQWTPPTNGAPGHFAAPGSRPYVPPQGPQPTLRSLPGGGTGLFDPSSRTMETIVPGQSGTQKITPIDQARISDINSELKPLLEKAAMLGNGVDADTIRAIRARKGQRDEILTGYSNPQSQPSIPQTLSRQAENFQPARKQLDKATATDILKRAGGDREKARKMARELGYSF